MSLHRIHRRWIEKLRYQEPANAAPEESTKPVESTKPEISKEETSHRDSVRKVREAQNSFFQPSRRGY